ncbi:hypothetical protein VNO78_29144 [Psophocarpus tetragonolobus]|uniref:Protein kinase domain-containing protein n=1 Tax=Psophocarpus tetragonolobus TaxID=3891 RepID=A0AAN9RUK0_PSOTE
MELVSNILEALLMRGHVEEALRRIDLLMLNGCEPDFNSLLSVLCEKEKTIAALKLLDFILERDSIIDFSIYDKVLDALCREDLNVYSILCKIVEKRGSTDWSSWDELINSLNREGNTKQAGVLSRMIKGTDGGPTQQHGNDRKPSKNIFSAAMSAVDYCHCRGVTHRDLKHDGLLHSACDTPHYVAPELITNNGYYGAKADIWSCGVILFFMNAGDLPFRSDNDGSTSDENVVYQSSAGASSPAVPMNVGSIDGSNHGQVSKAASLSCVGSQPPWTSLSTSAGGSAFCSSRSSCRPWEWGDLLRRLATFIPSNWLGKPQAKRTELTRGQICWMNNGIDKIACESCGTSLSFTALPSWTSAEDLLIDQYGTVPSIVNISCFLLVSLLPWPKLKMPANPLPGIWVRVIHKVNYHWKGNICPESLLQFPPTPPSALIGGYKHRCDGLVQFHCLPVVVISAIELMSITRGPQIECFL